MRSGGVVIFAVAALLLAPAPVRGDDLGCLPKTNGQLVKWDKDWQADLSDHDVTYHVDSVTEKNVRGEPSGYVIRLSARESARKPQRKATIIKELAARFFCGRIVGVASDGGIKLGLPEPARRLTTVPAVEKVQAVFPSEDPAPELLSFRRWIKNAWVPAAVPAKEELFVCRIPGGPIACNKHDYDLLNRDPSLSSLPKSTVRLKLPGAFIRHSAELGWAKDEPIGPLADAAIAECPVLGRTFYCLAEEKVRYKTELEELERELSVQRDAAKPRTKAPKAKK